MIIALHLPNIFVSKNHVSPLKHELSSNPRKGSPHIQFHLFLTAKTAEASLFTKINLYIELNIQYFAGCPITMMLIGLDNQQNIVYLFQKINLFQ